MKTLANCNSIEFLKQTNKIRHFAGDLFLKAGIKEIRARQPEFTGNESSEEKEKKIIEQGTKNLSDMLDALVETDAEGTVKLLGMMCFMDSDDAVASKGVDLFGNAIELLNSKPVMDFLMTFAKLAR